MKTVVAAITLLLVGTSARQCRNMNVSIAASGRNGVFDISNPTNEIEITNLVLLSTRQGHNYTYEVLKDYATVSGSYHIAATYCEPDSGQSSIVQILTHGLGANRAYWDAPINNFNYSYALEAVDKYGFSTFAYDRLGIGESSRPNPLSVVQDQVEANVLKVLSNMLKSGNITGKPFEKIAHTGHSYGSQLTYLLTTMDPGISDCLTLQGFSQNGSYPPEFLLGSNFVPARGYADGYISAAGIQSVQIEFFGPTDFDLDVLEYAYSTRAPVTAGQLLTSPWSTISPNFFAGPVHIVTGDHDIPFCGGNCLSAPAGYSSIPATSANFFTKASVFDVSIIPNCGHGVNFNFGHTDAYTKMLDFLVQNGCAPKGANGRA